jgi:acyl-CoA reductase-like NAD-dependent aldehyde dehydrogenase
MTIARQLLIEGKEAGALDGRTTEDRDPYSGEVMATVAAASPADATRAVDAASAAFAGWSVLAPSDRRKLFLRAAD